MGINRLQHGLGRRSARAALGAGLAAAALSALPASAMAAKTIGSDLDNAATATNGACAGASCTASHATLAAGDTAPDGLTSPIDGVVVSWKIKVGAATGPVALRVTRPGGATLTRTGAGTGGTFTPPANQTTTTNLSPGLPILTGDGIGVDCCTAGTENFLALSAGASTPTWVPRLQDGESPSRANSGTDPDELLIQATIEPDVDGDRLGDETQDGCPASALVSATCTDLAVRIAPSAASVTAGDIVNYDITVTNKGPQIALNPQLTLRLTSSDFVSVNPGAGSCTGRATVSCQLNALPPGGSNVTKVEAQPVITGKSQDLAIVTNSITDPIATDNFAVPDVDVQFPTVTIGSKAKQTRNKIKVGIGCGAGGVTVVCQGAASAATAKSLKGLTQEVSGREWRRGLGSAGFELPAGVRQSVEMRLSRQGQKLLGRRKRVAIRVKAHVFDQAGKQKVVERVINMRTKKYKPAKKKKKRKKRKKKR